MGIINDVIELGKEWEKTIEKAFLCNDKAEAEELLKQLNWIESNWLKEERYENSDAKDDHFDAKRHLYKVLGMLTKRKEKR